MTARPALPSSAELTLLTNEEFSARWRTLVGEVPAVMLQDRAEMIRLLVESVTQAEGPLGADQDQGTDPAPEDDAAGTRITGLRELKEGRGEG